MPRSGAQFPVSAREGRTMTNPPGHDPEFDQQWAEQLLQVDVEFADNPEPRCPCLLPCDRMLGPRR